MDMKDLVALVEVWAKDKGLDEADPKAQYLKVSEECGEIAAALARSDEKELKYAIGDTIVMLIILALQKGLSAEECLEKAKSIELARGLNSLLIGISTEMKTEPKYYIHVEHEGSTTGFSYVNYSTRSGKYLFSGGFSTDVYQTQFTQAEIDASPFLKKLEEFKVLVQE